MIEEIKQPRVRLLADRLLVSVNEEKEETVTSGGIIIPKGINKESDSNATLVGVVMKLSPKITNSDVEEDKVYEGEEVLFSKYAGTDLELDMKKYKIIRITDVIGALEK